MHPSCVVEELLRRCSAPSFSLFADLSVECAFRDPLHRLDKCLLPNLFERAKRKSSRPGGRLRPAPLETARLPAEREPEALQKLYPLLCVVLELGPYRWVVYDVFDLPCAKAPRLIQYVLQQARAHRRVIAFPVHVEQYEGEGRLHARKRPERDATDRSAFFLGHEAPPRAHRARRRTCGRGTALLPVGGRGSLWPR